VREDERNEGRYSYERHEPSVDRHRAPLSMVDFD
jgi:hypothetical protein